MRYLIVPILAGLLGGAPAMASSSAPAVHIKDFAYNPRSLKISAGQTVTFTNDDEEAHTVTATDGTFDSKGLDTNGVWQHTFAKPGVYKYFCELHPFMKGTIVVNAAGS